MGKPDYPVTSAVRMLRDHKIPFVPHLFTYEEHGGTKQSAAELGVDEHAVVKTLVMETDVHEPIIVLMHGDAEVSTKNLARSIGVRSVQPCDERTAERHTGYVFGGTSPFGTRRTLPVYVEKSILSLSEIYINGGKRGFLVQVDPRAMHECFSLTEVEVAIPRIP